MNAQHSRSLSLICTHPYTIRTSQEVFWMQILNIWNLLQTSFPSNNAFTSYFKGIFFPKVCLRNRRLDYGHITFWKWACFFTCKYHFEFKIGKMQFNTDMQFKVGSVNQHLHTEPSHSLKLYLKQIHCNLGTSRNNWVIFHFVHCILCIFHIAASDSAQM